MSKIIITSSTNSSHDVPFGAEVNTQELQALINQYLPITDASREILSVDISTLPDYRFVDDDEGDDWENNEASRWEQILTKVGKSSVSLVFVHSKSGDELFFEYRD